MKNLEGSLVKQAFIGHKGWISSVCWRPDDENCFTSASYDKTVKMWDIRCVIFITPLFYFFETRL